MANGDKKQLHVVMIPWSAFGHLIPFFQLSIALAKSGIQVSFISTPKIIQRLPKLPSPDLNLNLISLPLPTLDETLLPPEAEATVDISFEQIQYLKIAYDRLKEPVREFVKDQNPDWIIIDMIPCWVDEIAREFQIPVLHFSVFTAATYCFMVHPDYLIGEGQRMEWSTPESLTFRPKWFDVDLPDSTLAYKLHDAIGFHAGVFGENASGITDAERVHKIIFSASRAVIVRSSYECEGEYLKLMEKNFAMPVIPIGLLPPEKPKGVIGDVKISTFLDEQDAKSVVFVGFGSECKLSKEIIHEIAHGLELSNLPFLWAIRKPNWAKHDLDVLPLGFTDRTSGRGLVSIGWAPQMEILAHPSIGGSLFHAGWGSVIETLQFGHVLVVLPFIIDQPLNAKLLVEKDLAMEIEKNEDGSICREEIAKTLNLAMVSEEGESLRERARDAAKIYGNHELHQSYIDKFVEYLRNGAAN
jgi:hypothetical protein